MTLIKLRQKLFLLLFALLSVGLVLPTYVINRTIDTQVKTEITNSLLSHNKAFELYSRSSNLDIGIAALNFSKQTGLRVTLIAKDGKVVAEADSNIVLNKMDNHLNRPEVQNLKNIQQELEINKVNPKIIAVSKTFPIEHINPLLDHGHLIYGENRVQEAKDKTSARYWSCKKW